MVPKSFISPQTYRFAFWAVGLLLCWFFFFFQRTSHLFSYDYQVWEMPLITLVIALISVGGLFVVLRFLLPRLNEDQSYGRSWVLAIFLIGLIARLVLLTSEPILEDDYQRYLWDGGLLAHGINPYLYSPAQVLSGAVPQEIIELAGQAHPIVERINHPELRTIYPPGSEGAFALAHLIAPFSLQGWRMLILFAEIASFGLLLLLMHHVGRTPVWLVLYWWNPVVIKELMNSAHMEALLVPFMLGGLYLAIKNKPAWASLLVSLAASLKFWPALLLPLIWQRMIKTPLVLFGSIVVALIVGLMIIWPYLTSGLNESSGLVAYGYKWKTNSALFPAFEQLVIWISQLFDTAGFSLSQFAPLIARGLIGGLLIAIVFWLAIHPQFFSNFKPAGKNSNPENIALFNQIIVVSSLIFLLSPAQFPWYFVWIAPYLVFYPLWGFVVLVPMMAFYYFAGFYLYVEGLAQDYKFGVALLVWLPVWTSLLIELAQYRKYKSAQ